MSDKQSLSQHQARNRSPFALIVAIVSLVGLAMTLSMSRDQSNAGVNLDQGLSSYVPWLSTIFSLLFLSAAAINLRSIFKSKSESKPWAPLLKVLQDWNDSESPPSDIEIKEALDSFSESELNELSAAISKLCSRYQKAADLAESQSRKKTDFLARMSHEIRAPMNGVLGMITLLSETKLSEDQAEFTTIAKSSANALLALVNNILDLSKIEAGKLQLKSIPFNLRLVLEEVGDILANSAHHKDIELAIEYPPESPENFIGDPNRIRQIFLNLLSNGVKFTEEGGVSLSVSGRHVDAETMTLVVEVQDSGDGISKEEEEELFQPFTQGKSGRARSMDGTGLGLVIAHSLASAMKGSMTVESQSGVGTCFRTELPLRLGTETKPSGKVAFAKSRALIIGSATKNRAVLESYLQFWDCSTLCAESFEDARAALKEKKQCAPFDFVFVDHDLTQSLKNDHLETTLQSLGGDGARFLLVSSLPEQVSATNKLAQCFDARMTKPLRRDKLRELLTELNQSELGRAQPVDAPSTPELSEVTRPERVLLVEDHEINQKLMTELLKMRGFAAPEWAKNGKEALDRIRSKRFDFVLMDCEMPVMDGFQASLSIRQLELREQSPRVPIVAMTAKAMKGDRDLCLNAGMDDYITKPIRERELDRVLNFFVPKTKPDLEEETGGLRKRMKRGASMKSLKALVVEDNITNRMILGSFLKLNDIQFEEAENGALAVEKCREALFDVILMDCQMPVLDGYGATELIRSECPKNKQTPILAVTANVAKGNKDRCLEVGMNGFLSKPYTEESLVESIQEILGLKSEQAPEDLTVFNPTVLTKLLPLASGTQRKIVTSFMVELKELFESLRPWPDSISKETQRACLGLKGLAANLGMALLKADLESLSKWLREEKMEEAQRAFKKCEEDWKKTAPHCEKFLKELR